MKNLKKLIGFPIGVMMLVLSYIGVYLIEGINGYQNYLNELTDITVFVNQTACAGMFYLIFINFTNKLVELLNNKDKTSKKDITLTAIWFIVSALVGVAIDKFAMFTGESVVDILIGSPFILLVIGYIVYLIKNMINVHSINKKLEKRS